MGELVRQNGKGSEASDQMREREDPQKFLRYLREHVSVELLLASRTGQAELDRRLSREFSIEGEPVYDTPNPLVNPYPILRMSDGFIIRTTFQLKDGEFYYYFPNARPAEPVPSYLRPEDVVPSGVFTPRYDAEAIMHDFGVNKEGVRYMIFKNSPELKPYTTLVDIPFNKPFNRVPVTGGEAERFNYNTQSWEANGARWRGQRQRGALAAAGERVRGVFLRKTSGSGRRAITDR